MNSFPTPQGGADGAVDQFGTLCFIGDLHLRRLHHVRRTRRPDGDRTPIITAGGPGSTNFVPNNVEPVNSANATCTSKARYYDVTLR